MQNLQKVCYWLRVVSQDPGLMFVWINDSIGKRIELILLRIWKCTVFSNHCLIFSIMVFLSYFPPGSFGRADSRKCRFGLQISWVKFKSYYCFSNNLLQEFLKDFVNIFRRVNNGHTFIFWLSRIFSYQTYSKSF